MCGIAGFAGEGSRDVLERMTGTLEHRGPDDVGFLHVPGTIGFGLRRLAIIDISTGNQPVFNEDKTVAVLMNGEIYNFQSLRKSLAARHTFVTQGDTEVIAHLYEDFGEELFTSLNGMFAIALWDSVKQKLVLARDRFGKKPLYYTIADNTLIFASEPKAILQHPLVRPELDFRALNLYLTHEYVPAPTSIFKDISKIEAGHYAVFQDKKIVKRPYYRLSLNAVNPPSSFRECLCEFDRIMDDAVKLRLISDVPLGIFLSGGIDSSTITYYAQRASNAPVKTFSIGFDNPSFDESAYARNVARHLHTDHHERTFRAQELLDLIPTLVALLDEPISDSAIFSNFLLSRFAREHVTVVVGGDGGDELFFGYPTFQAHRLSPLLLVFPQTVRRHIIEPLVENMPVSHRHLSSDYKLKRFLLGLRYGADRRDAIWIGSFTPEEKRALLASDVQELLGDMNDFEVIDRYAAEVHGKPLLARSSYIYQKTYLTDDVMMHKDRASMFASLELRVPFLDYRIVDFVNSLPTGYKLRGFTTKYFLKQLMKERLPHDILYRRKRGFSLPMAQWLCRELKPLLLDVLSESAIRREGIFRYPYIKQLIGEHFAGKKNNYRKLWTLALFQLWKERWL